ncbi:MAG: oxidoreductase, partial [Pseudomonadota bacterium]|nr:oxidoreductase [Pseudomonadota bacterium]
MPQLIKDDAIVDDRWTLLRDASSLADVPEATPIIVPLSLWLGNRAVMIARGDAGVWLAPAEDPA